LFVVEWTSDDDGGLPVRQMEDLGGELSEV